MEINPGREYDMPNDSGSIPEGEEISRKEIIQWHSDWQRNNSVRSIIDTLEDCIKWVKNKQAEQKWIETGDIDMHTRKGEPESAEFWRKQYHNAMVEMELQ